MDPLKIDTRKHTYKNVSPAEIVSALDGLTMEQAHIYAAAPELLEAAQNTITYYTTLEPRRICLADNLNPCGGLKFWQDNGPACPLCSARAAIAQAEGRA